MVHITSASEAQKAWEIPKKRSAGLLLLNRTTVISAPGGAIISLIGCYVAGNSQA